MPLERQQFVKTVLSGRWTMTELCQRFGISRNTGEEVMGRHDARDLAGLADAGRAPKTHPNQSRREVEAAVLRVRKACERTIRTDGARKYYLSNLPPRISAKELIATTHER